MATCKCKTKPRIVSHVVQSINKSDQCGCLDVCANPIVADPRLLGIMAPLIYDEIGINLCTTFDLGTDISTTYPTATNASISVIGATYTYGDGNVQIESLVGRPYCYLVTLANITIQFAVTLYDAACRQLGIIYPTAVYLPPADEETYDEDTNPSSVELELFAPYGLSYDTETVQYPTPVIKFVGFGTTDSAVGQGINLFAMAKMLDFSTEDDTATVGVTLVLQSMYYAGYKVQSAGKIDIPKGSIMAPDNSDCIRFVAGDLLNLAIKPLDLGDPGYEEYNKEECSSGSCSCGNKVCQESGAADTTAPVATVPVQEPTI